MHQLATFLLFFALNSSEIYAADLVELDENINTPELSLDSHNKGQSKDALIVGVAAAATGGIFFTLGSVGVANTCSDLSIAAAKVLCGFSGAGIALGGFCLLAAIPMGYYVYNSQRVVEPQD